MEAPLVLASSANGVGRLTFNRPEQRNAMSPEMMDVLHQELEKMGRDPAVRCVVIAGSGGNFVAGGNIKAWSRFQTMAPAERSEYFRTSLDASLPLIQMLDSFEKPVIVEMQGYAAGAGLCFVLAADFVIADDTARFLFANIRAALVPDMGITYYLAKRVGERRAMRLSLLGSQVDAKQAEEMGIVDEVVAPEALQGAVDALAKSLIAAPAKALAETKKLIRLSRHATLVEQFNAERDALADCAGEDDFLEAVAAFAERRAPKFGGSN